MTSALRLIPILIELSNDQRSIEDRRVVLPSQRWSLDSFACAFPLMICSSSTFFILSRSRVFTLASQLSSNPLSTASTVMPTLFYAAACPSLWAIPKAPSVDTDEVATDVFWTPTASTNRYIGASQAVLVLGSSTWLQSFPCGERTVKTVIRRMSCASAKLLALNANRELRFARARVIPTRTRTAPLRWVTPPLHGPGQLRLIVGQPLRAHPAVYMWH